MIPGVPVLRTRIPRKLVQNERRHRRALLKKFLEPLSALREGYAPD
jgi:hypothetical protein